MKNVTYYAKNFKKYKSEMKRKKYMLNYYEY